MNTWSILVLIIGIIMAFAGIIFGLIKGEQARSSIEMRSEILDLERKLTAIDSRIYGTESRISVVEKLDALRHKNNGQV
jgi:hypothetical protein